MRFVLRSATHDDLAFNSICYGYAFVTRWPLIAPHSQVKVRELLALPARALYILVVASSWLVVAILLTIHNKRFFKPTCKQSRNDQAIEQNTTYRAKLLETLPHRRRLSKVSHQVELMAADDDMSDLNTQERNQTADGAVQPTGVSHEVSMANSEHIQSRDMAEQLDVKVIQNFGKSVVKI